MRSIGMDIHRSFAQISIVEDGTVIESFRIDVDHDAVVAFGKGLRKTDEMVLEATGNTATVVRLLSPFVARMITANPMQVKVIAHARVKTDKVDAKILAQLHAAGFLPEVWSADDATLNLRRLVSERAATVRSIRRLKSRVQAVLHANLVPKYAGHLFWQGWPEMAGESAATESRTRSVGAPSRRVGMDERQVGEARCRSDPDLA